MIISVLEIFQRWLPFRLNWKLTSKSYLDLNYLSTVFGQSVEDVDQIVEKVTKFYFGNKPAMQGSNFEFASVSIYVIQMCVCKTNNNFMAIFSLYQTICR